MAEQRKAPLGTVQVEAMMDRRVEDISTKIEAEKRRSIVRQIAGLICFITYAILLVMHRMESAEFARMFALEEISEIPTLGFWHFLEGQAPGIAGIALLAPEALDLIGNLFGRFFGRGGS